MSDLPPELRDVPWQPERHRSVRPAWWRAVSGGIALVLIGLLVVAYTL